MSSEYRAVELVLPAKAIEMIIDALVCMNSVAYESKFPASHDCVYRDAVIGELREVMEQE